MATLKDISAILVKNHQLKQEEADAFLSAVTETILEGLRNDRVVKVKGFGVFKLTSVKDRESINVNTGERVLISGHDKITFTPDAVMRDKVNKPFAQFETVDLSDGVNFEDVPNVELEEEVAKISESVDYPEEQTNVMPAVEPVSPIVENEIESITEEKLEETSEAAEEQVEEQTEETQIEEVQLAEKTESAEEPAITEQVVDNIETSSDATSETSVEVPSDETAEVSSESSVDKKDEEELAEEFVEDQSNVSVENSVVEPTLLPIVNPQPQMEPVSENVEEEIVEPSCNWEDEDELAERKKVFLIFAIVINVIIAVLFFVLGYCACSKNFFGSNTQTSKTDSLVTIKSQKDSTQMRNAQQENVQSVPKILVYGENGSVEEIKQPENRTQTEQKSESVQPAEEESSATSQYDSDPRIRTGAYKIVGTSTTVIVKPGQTIKSISRQTLGAGMECYLEVYNGGVTELTAGQKLKIPKLVLKKKAK